MKGFYFLRRKSLFFLQDFVERCLVETSMVVVLFGISPVELFFLKRGD